MSYKYVLITFLGSLIILGLLSNRLNYREGLTDPPHAAKVDSAKPGDSPPPPSPGNRPYEFDPKLVEAAAKAWDEKEKKKWAKKRADEAKNKLNRYNSDNKRMDDLKKARKTARLAREEKDVNFVEEQQAQAKNRNNTDCVAVLEEGPCSLLCKSECSRFFDFHTLFYIY